jgi:hypothetical protein
MKSKLLLVILAIALTGCQQTEERYTQQSPEINTVKAFINGYNTMNYDFGAVADTCKTYFNTKTEFMAKNELMAYHSGNDKNYSSRKFLDADQEYEMVITDDGETWVNCWLDWQGKLKGSDIVIDMPVHLTYRFIDGLIVKQVGMWDPSNIIDGLEKIAAMNSATSTSKRARVEEVAEIEEMPPTSLASSSEKDEQNLSDKIGSLLRNPEFVVDDNSKATVRFTVNASNQVVVLSVNAVNSEIKDFVIERLNYHLLDFNYPKKMKVYTLPIRIVSN